MPRRTRRRDASGHADPYHARRKRYEQTLRHVGLADDFAALPRLAKEIFFKLKTPDLTLCFAAEDPAAPPPAERGLVLDQADRRTLRELLDPPLREAKFDTDAGEMSTRDFFGVLDACLRIVDGEPSEVLPPPVRAFMREAKPRLNEFHDKHFLDACRSVYHIVHGPLLTREPARRPDAARRAPALRQWPGQAGPAPAGAGRRAAGQAGEPRRGGAADLPRRHRRGGRERRLALVVPRRARQGRP